MYKALDETGEELMFEGNSWGRYQTAPGMGTFVPVGNDSVHLHI